ncbi:TadE/TadG family type IV pilus assembly protein [Enterovirga rhinocerotis]|uniref:Flp pilus assembly protein TadG n=1 Tax=Enterovirga rhinocerotis TaxID=1339210 RepID=A0A4R7C8Q5_9HYPH|nr:TadE/TadG family type IV pilus assembly protein [Enterovirga rhinocerotis]TDR94643.1 Flp pilus assembly protein TadG [Enterovirga rhinocerotis]
MGLCETIRRSGALGAHRFRRDRSGNVAVLFGLSLVPLVGLAGVAVDYSRATELRTFLHRETDATALAIASSDSPNEALSIAAFKARVTTRYGGASGLISQVGTADQWTAGSIYTLTANASIATTLSVVLPGYPRTIPVSVTTAVKRKPPVWAWSLPTVRDMSYEAGDYNRISVYCYDESKKNQSNKGRMLNTLTAISDNGGTDYSKAKLPVCADGETLSYQLRNVRNARTTPANWDKPSAEHYLYYTDTTIEPNSRKMTNTVTGGRESANGTMTMTDLSSAPILETIICTTDVDCKSRNQGGILPNNNETGRTPKTATGACADGKSMYYGWEDRPPTPSGGSDRDYDDIRIVVSCPTLQRIADKEIRIIR